MELLRDFKNISKNDISIAGGKGASLGEMTGAGISVPPDLVILPSSFEKDLLRQKTSVAVVVQEMVESKKSGIAFSVHPVTQDRNKLIIEAGFGLGEARVSRQITPDSYVVEKQPRRIIDKNVQTQARGPYRAKTGGLY